MFFKKKTADEMRISDWSSDVCSSDLADKVYSLENKEGCETRVRYTLAGDSEAHLAGERALAAYRLLGCRDAARLDFKSDADGSPQFLEVNPIAGLHPTHSDLPMLAARAGMGYDALIGAILDAALARYGMSRGQPLRSGGAAR